VNSSWTPNLDDLLSGRKRGALASVSRCLLSAGAAGYALGAWLRNHAYDRGWKRIERAAIPVVSIGNLTTGGTGKTPFAAFIARWYRERGVRVAFISRGYGAHDAATNDEALVLDALCPDVPHLQNPDRVAAAQIARVELESQLVILDDGFQHRRLARDLDIVLIDATNPWGFGRLLPRGLLREPPSSLKRAHVVVITRVDQVDRGAIEAIRHSVNSIGSECDIVEVAFPAARLVGANGQTARLEPLAGRTVAAFCGIGNPVAFRASLERLGCTVRDFRTFPDHYNYTRADIEELDRWIRPLAIDAVVCTQKDLVKISLESLGDRPLWAVEIGTQIVAGRDALDARLTRVLAAD
jgi:tetraacyldisaccharide 4'-kinase